MWVLVIAAALAQEPCAKVGMGHVMSLPAPAVVVLGERKATQPDLVRAHRIVGRLAARAPVTLALEAVDRSVQPVLDEVASTRDIEGLEDKLAFHEHWGFGYAPYAPLVERAALGVKVVGVGLPRGPRPADVPVPLPPGYMHVLRDGMGEQEVPTELESRFVQMVAYRDHSIASRAIGSWSGEGYLVILADRLHVEGNKGIQWQAQRMTAAPVHAFLLADAGAACYPGDQILR